MNRKQLLKALGLSFLLRLLPLSACASLNYDSSLGSIVEHYVPEGTALLKKSSADQVKDLLEKNIPGPYTKTIRVNGEYLAERHASAEFSFVGRQGEGRFEQDILIIQDGAKREELLVSNVKDVEGIVLESETGLPEAHLRFSYEVLEEVPKGVPFYKVSYFDVLVSDKHLLEDITEVIYTLAQGYRWKQLDVKCEENLPFVELVSPSVPEPEQPPPVVVVNEELPPPVRALVRYSLLSSFDLETLCNGQALQGRYQATLVHKYGYPECGSSAPDLSDIHSLPDGAFYLICGNASEPGAALCQEGEYANFNLSWDRAEAAAQRLEQLVGPSVTLYPNGTRLNEQSVRIYLIEKAELINDEVR